MLLNRKQGLSEGQSELLAAMSGFRLHQAQVKPSAPDRKDSSPAAAKPDTAATEQASPQGKVFTDPRAYARALAQWEKDNHFDYDNPMPHDYVPEPRPELRRSASADAGSPTQSAAQAAAQQEAERAAHQAALDAGYR